MAGNVTTKVFKGGMNKDIDVSLLPEDTYIDAQNYKLVADDGSNSYILENAEGNSLWFDLSGTLTDNYYLVGHCFIKPYLVLFLTENHIITTPGGAGTSVILRLTIGADEIQETEVIYTDGVDSSYLAFSDLYPINAVGNYEAPDNIKVYFTDNYHPVRVINIMDENLSTYTAGMLDLTPDFPLNSSVQPRPTIISLVDGALPVCSIQYAYQYYIDKGVKTLFSPASKLQNIPMEFDTSNWANHIGGDVGEESPYGVKFTIGVPSENLYPKIRIVAIQYNSYNAIPLIRVIKEQTLVAGTASTLTIIDTGTSINELAYEEFSVQNNSVYRAKDLAIKDNRLFMANIREELYDVDFDARAYRHNDIFSDAKAQIWQSDLTTDHYVKDDGTEDYTYSEVPETHSCINKYNDADLEANASYLYIYQADGTTLGAEGENIKVGIFKNDVTLDSIGASATTLNIHNLSVNGTTTSYLMTDNRSFQRTEVYRLGIVFRNDKMQTSPVKWICDLKMPHHLSYPYVEQDGSRLLANKLALNITMSNFPSNEASTWEVVYVPRTLDDRGVLAQGIIQPAAEDATGPYYEPNAGFMRPEDVSAYATVDYSPVCWFHSPEIAFNKNLEYKTGDFYNKIGIFDFDTANYLDELSVYQSKHYKVFDFTPQGNYAASYKQAIDDAKVIPYNTNPDLRVTLDGESAKAYSDLGPDCPYTTKLATEQGVFNTAFIDPSAGGSSTQVVVANYRRNVFTIQYGGLSYHDRQFNNYIAASDLKFTDTNIITYEGDTYIDFFWDPTTLQDIPTAILGGNTYYVSFLFPVETSISTRLSHSDYVYRHPTSAKHRLNQEISGDWEGEVPTGGTTWKYTQEDPLFLYNSVYSQLPRANIYIADGDDFDSNYNYPTRIIASNKKINNETLDAFTQFGVNEFLDVDGSKGEIKNLKVFKNDLYFWQEAGFGIASVNKRSLIEDNNPGGLVLGTGGILDRFDYISDHIGNQNQFGIVLSRRSIYWIDNNKNEFCKYDGDLKPISKIKGIQTWINSIGDIGNSHLVYDHKYNDVIFTMTFSRSITAKTLDNSLVETWNAPSPATNMLEDGTKYACILPGRYTAATLVGERNVLEYDNDWESSKDPYGDVGNTFYFTLLNDSDLTYTISYNEIVDKFISYNSFTPVRYITTDTTYYSTDNYHDLYKHNSDSAPRCSYYGVVYDSTFTTSFNKDYQYTKVWDALKWVTESFDSDDINQFSDTFQKLEIYNDYQNTGERDLVYGSTPSTGETEITRRERTWSMSIPRNIVDVNVSSNPDIHDVSNHDETQTFKERIRDKYMTCKFTYDNDDGYILSIPFISAIYRKSQR